MATVTCPACGATDEVGERTRAFCMRGHPEVRMLLPGERGDDTVAMTIGEPNAQRALARLAYIALILRRKFQADEIRQALNDGGITSWERLCELGRREGDEQPPPIPDQDSGAPTILER